MTGKLHLRLSSERESIQKLSEAVDEFGLEQGWPAKLLFQTRLVLEELVINVINHGFRKSGQSLEVQILSSPESLRIDLTDDAWPFNPLTDTPKADLEAALEDRQVGGLGVYLVRQMMDELHYAREDDKNHLTLIRRRDT